MRRRATRLLLALTTAILLANALAGDRGLTQTARVEREHQRLGESIAQLRQENQRLALQADRLRHDASAIEEIARGELGLIRPGERLFIITDRLGPRR